LFWLLYIIPSGQLVFHLVNFLLHKLSQFWKWLYLVLRRHL
jgi:hypothetical protein